MVGKSGCKCLHERSDYLTGCKKAQYVYLFFFFSLSFYFVFRASVSSCTGIISSDTFFQYITDYTQA